MDLTFMLHERGKCNILPPSKCYITQINVTFPTGILVYQAYLLI